jgi:hypothetical protein
MEDSFMKLSSLYLCLVTALWLVPVATALAFDGDPAPSQPQQVGDTGVITVSPRVPVPAGSPCVVTLFENQFLQEQQQGRPDSGTPYTYLPPAGCHGPWAKVVLKVDVTDFGGQDPARPYVRLGSIELFEGSLASLFTQPTAPTWQIERDVTDLAPLLAQAHSGQVGLVPDQAIWQDNETTTQATLSAQLLFYRASSSAPAPKTPDAVYRVLPEANTVTLPHNIVRAYLDVYNEEPWWFTCVTDQESYAFYSSLAMGGARGNGIGPPSEGCGGGSFAEIGVRIDGTPAGVAPVFPLLLDANYNYPTAKLNAPIQPPQLLNHIPYRVDITPFAAILNEAGAHTIAIGRRARAYLLVYQDKASAHLSGAVTLNTLAGSPGMPTVSDTIQITGDTAAGTITTAMDRDFKIQGFVNTSHGRVDSSVHQTSHFQNTQKFYLYGLDGVRIPEARHYQQDLWLASNTMQHSHRTRAGFVLNDDVGTTSYPLNLNYAMDGFTEDNGDGVITAPSSQSVSAEQHRDLDVGYLKGGFGLYNSRVRESFVSSHDVDMTLAQSSNWKAQAHYRFYDNQGSCYQSALTALNGAVSTEAKGVGCSYGHNRVQWFAHPDGSPDSLGWAH